MSGELNSRDLILIAVTAAAFVSLSLSPAPQVARVKVIAPPVVEFFGGRDVKLLPGPFLDTRVRTQSTLLSIDLERLLHTFRLNAGLASTAAPYGGWESPQVELRGHTLGHYLTACSRMYASTSDVRFHERVTSLVAELEKVQSALEKNGSRPGYLSAFPESFIDRVEERKPVWAPYYTLHKIMAGLLDAHELCSNSKALQILIRMADWVDGRMGRLTRAQQQQMLQTEFGGMAEVLARLALATGEPRYLRLSQSFDHEAVLGPLRRGNDSLDGLHGNTQIPKLIGAMVQYGLTGDPAYHTSAKFFWERVAHHRSYVIGGNTNDEHFFPISQFSHQMGPASTETCNSYNMIRLSAALFAHAPNGRIMDFVERALLNHILASQDPSTGMFCYYVSMKPGAYKTFSTPDSSFWCCVGTGLENPARTVETIYAHDAQTLFINQFIASTVSWTGQKVTVRQETLFPSQDRTMLRIQTDSPRRFRLAIRRPAWTGRGFRIVVNGRHEPGSSSNGYDVVDRAWRDGDSIEVLLPMRLTMETMPDDTNIVTFMHGPIVLAGDLGTEGMGSVQVYGPEGPDREKTAEVPTMVTDRRADVMRKIIPDDARPGVFRTVGFGRRFDVALVPFYLMFHRKYSVYWDLMTPDQWENREAERNEAMERHKEIERRTIDVVRTDLPSSEQKHRLVSDRSSNHWYDGRRSRHAFNGSFGYTLASDPVRPVSLMCEYQGRDARERACEVLVDGTIIATEDFATTAPGFFQRYYDVPYELTRRKDSLSVTFRAKNDRLTGAVFELRTLR